MSETVNASRTKPAPPPPAWRLTRRSGRAAAIIMLTAFVAMLAVLAAWGLPPFGGGAERTNNAYVRGRTTVISPQVSGYVSEVRVKDYETVRKGQILVRIDDAVYSARVEQAKAALAAQQAALANNAQTRASRKAGLSAKEAAIASARAQLRRAQADMGRADDLVDDGSISIRERDQTLAALRLAEAQLSQAEAAAEIARQEVRTADVGGEGLEEKGEAARAALNLAEVNLGYATVSAPEDGQAGEIGVRLGQFVAPGAQLFSIVPEDYWVIANFKEAQTARMEVGQPVMLRVDALGGRKLKGHIERLSPAAGSEFAVLKPDNATGNFIKVPQRIGARIKIDPDQTLTARLRPGMSVEVQVELHR